MMDLPRSFNELSRWANDRGFPVNEARDRLAQAAVLHSFSTSNRLRTGLVFKGGNALDFVWSPNRSTSDLDFSLDYGQDGSHLDGAWLREAIKHALLLPGPSFRITMQLQRFRQNPPGADRQFVTYDITVGYAFEDERQLALVMREGRSSNNVVPVEVSLNEVVCGAELVTMADGLALRVSTVEDIVAEKLRALLQQIERNRYRPQDVLDIAMIVQRGGRLDTQRVGEFLLRKASARDVTVSKAAFRSPELSDRARRNYESLRATVRTEFIEFDNALALVHRLVDSLPIP